MGAAFAPRGTVAADQPTAGAGPGRTPANLAGLPKQLEGVGFGVGIGITFDLHRGTNRLGEAELVTPGNIVRLKESHDVIAGFVFETHYFFPFAFDHPGIMPRRAPAMGHGPFAAIEVGSTAGGGSGVITAYALGWMVGLRNWELLEKPDGSYFGRLAPGSWNFGIGLRVDPKAKALGDGIVANQPLPPGETAIRTKTAPRYGLMLVTSFGF
ncbi:MAG: hypothetical protein K2Y71_13145 [Xanthobacteraceae bacterium]|nr:hypothetical protein [Xanthobacteraceae bacterium]